MISLDVHDVRKITAKANACAPDNNWVTIDFGGPQPTLHITLFFDCHAAQAEAYAAAINAVKIMPAAPVLVEQEEAA